MIVSLRQIITINSVEVDSRTVDWKRGRFIIHVVYRILHEPLDKCLYYQINLGRSLNIGVITGLSVTVNKQRHDRVAKSVDY